jgi:choloylglycine hydrolase
LSPDGAFIGGRPRSRRERRRRAARPKRAAYLFNDVRIEICAWRAATDRARTWLAPGRAEVFRGPDKMKDRKTTLVALAVAGALASFGASLGAGVAEACTSMIFKAEDGTRIYARTMEWGASDLKSEMMLAPRGFAFSSDLGEGKSGAAWSARLGFVGVNADGLPYATDGMNEAGLTVGALFFPGFAQYQEPKAGELATTVSNVDLVNYILSNFKTVAEVREAMPKIRVVRNAAIEKQFGTPLPLHHIVSDPTGASIVIEYMDGKLSIDDNRVGAMTNSPGYDWHLLNLRNYANLTPRPAPASSIDGVSLAPFGAGSGMLGLPGDFTPPSRFVRAVAFVNTMIPARDAADAVNAASVMLNNFDIPKGLVREGASPEDFHLGYTQWSVIADMSHRVYYYWTMYDRRMRSVDLGKLDFGGKAIAYFPLDKVRVEDIQDRSGDFGR